MLFLIFFFLLEFFLIPFFISCLLSERGEPDINNVFWLFLVWPSFIYYTLKSKYFGRLQALIYFLDELARPDFNHNMGFREENINISLNVSRLNNSDCRYLLKYVLPSTRNILILYSDDVIKNIQ